MGMPSGSEHMVPPLTSPLESQEAFHPPAVEKTNFGNKQKSDVYAS